MLHLFLAIKTFYDPFFSPFGLPAFNSNPFTSTGEPSPQEMLGEVPKGTYSQSSFSTSSSNFNYSTIDKYGNTISILKENSNRAGRISIVFTRNVPLKGAMIANNETIQTKLIKDSGKVYQKEVSKTTYGTKAKDKDIKVSEFNEEASAEIDKIINELEEINSGDHSSNLDFDFFNNSFWDMEKRFKENENKRIQKENLMMEKIEQLYKFLE